MKWHVDGQFDADVCVDIRDEDDSAICEVGPFEEDWTPGDIQRVHLIAAAPDLLEAATQTLGLCRIRGECADVQPDEYCCGEHVALASAIEKAEGKL